MVTIPIDADQPVNAERCRSLGVADIITPGQRNVQAVRDSVRAVLADPSYRRNAQRLQKEMAELPGPEHAVSLLAELVERRKRHKIGEEVRRWAG
jgi:UDP:flavonoid glycosyltransferase YjiC (YdhE family)